MTLLHPFFLMQGTQLMHCIVNGACRGRTNPVARRSSTEGAAAYLLEFLAVVTVKGLPVLQFRLCAAEKMRAVRRMCVKRTATGELGCVLEGITPFLCSEEDRCTTSLV